jgi:hypothetical protein
MNEDKVQCQICKKWFKQITGKHLQLKHNITFEEYKEMFPDAETHPQWLRDQLVDANKEKWSDPEYKVSTAKTISDKNKVVMNEPEMTEKLKAGSKRRWSHEEERERQGRNLSKQWENEDFKKMQHEKALKQWEDENFRNAVIEAGKKQTGDKNPFYKPEIDVWIEENTNKHLCKCGCNRFIIITRDQYHDGIPQFYCIECYNNYNKISENNPMFGKEHTDETKQLMRKIADERWSNLEERILMSCRLQGVSREEWDGFMNRSDDLYYSQKYKQWRTSVYERDDYTCQLCGERGNTLNGHHIYKVSDYPDLIFEINNGITLCYDCHFHEVNGHEKEYEIEFLSKIFDNKGIKIFGGE